MNFAPKLTISLKSLYFISVSIASDFKKYNFSIGLFKVTCQRFVVFFNKLYEKIKKFGLQKSLLSKLYKIWL